MGNLVMYKVEQGTNNAPGDTWHGPARITGFDGNVVWTQHGSVPVATALHLLRPATTAEMLASMVMNRNKRRLGTVVDVAPSADQSGYIDATGVRADAMEVDHPPDPVFPQPTIRSNLEEDFAHPRDVIMDDPEYPSRELLAPERSHIPVELPDVVTPLEEHLTRTGVSRDDPGARLVRGLAERRDSAAASSRTGSRSRQEREENLVAHLFKEQEDEVTGGLFQDFEECQAFFADRVPQPEATAFKAVMNKGAKRELRRNRRRNEASYLSMTDLELPTRNYR